MHHAYRLIGVGYIVVLCIPPTRDGLRLATEYSKVFQTVVDEFSRQIALSCTAQGEFLRRLWLLREANTVRLTEAYKRVVSDSIKLQSEYSTKSSELTKALEEEREVLIHFTVVYLIMRRIEKI